MLWCWTSLLSFFFFSSLTGQVAAQIVCTTDIGKTQSGNNNYVIDYFSSVLTFPYAINQCTAADFVPSGKYYKYTCAQDDNDVWWITKKEYTTSGCSGAGTTIDVWSEEDTTEGEAFYFKCGGDNTYTKIALDVDSECQVPATIFGGLGGCASNPSVLDLKVYCDSTSAALQLYIPPAVYNGTYEMCDDTNLYCNQWSLAQTCGHVAEIFGIDLYGYMVSCVTEITPEPTKKPTTPSPTTPSPTTPAPTTSDDEDDDDDDDDDSTSSASSQFTLLAIVVSLIMSLFY